MGQPTLDPHRIAIVEEPADHRSASAWSIAARICSSGTAPPTRLPLMKNVDAHHLASPANIVAVRDKATIKEATADQRKTLGVGATEPIRYRRVKLTCGSHVLSEADNWYVPSRLTADMNHQLETTDIAFGRAVQPLHFQRRTLSAKLLWSPLPDGWEVKAAALPDAAVRTLQVPHEVLQHQAVLALPDGTPFSNVVETYTEAVLAFPQPRPAP
jgi:hypothetical protein